ncbi:MAG: glutathione ABC transporter substrate-binding protein [Oscillospiraceae bacterium]|jgi:peptide/nickel transport system substrate-binding protein|nr:glutathione ABC transporter substrate-binding protein [Oscillospiraceae bacterium]
MNRIKKILPLMLAMALIITLAGCNGGDSGSPSSDASQSAVSADSSQAQSSPTDAPSDELKDLIVATGTDASTLDPHLCTDSATEVINKNIYQNLVRYTAEMEIVPELATEWTTSEDGKTWRFTLRDDLKFHDGTDFNAEAVKINFERILAEETASPRRSVFAMIESVTVVDPTHVDILTSYPCGSFLQQLCHPAGGMISPAAIETHGIENLGQNPCGTGPLMLKEWTPGEKLVFDIFQDYYAGAPKVKSVTMNIVPDSSTRAMLIESGQCDVALRLPVTEIERLRGDANLTVTEGSTVMTMYIALNNTKGALQDPNVRRALNLAVDIDSIVKNVVSNFSEAADSVISKHTWGHASIGAYPYDPEQAKQLLKDAGHENLEITLWTPVGRYLMDIQVAEAIQAQLADVGVTLNIQQWEFQALMEEVKKAEFDAVLLGWSPSTADADQGLYPVFHSTQHPPQSNRALYSNADVDTLLEQAREEVDATKRADLYKQAQQIIMDDAAWLLLYYPNQALVTTKDVSGIELIPTEHMLFANVEKK